MEEGNTIDVAFIDNRKICYLMRVRLMAYLTL